MQKFVGVSADSSFEKEHITLFWSENFTIITGTKFLKRTLIQGNQKYNFLYQALKRGPDSPALCYI